MTTSEQSGERNSSDDSLTAIIEDVGDRIYEDVDFESQSQLYEQAKEWGQQHGLYRTEEPEKLLCRLAAYNRLLKMSLYSLYKIDDSSLPPITRTDDIADRLTYAREEIADAAFERYILDDLVEAAKTDHLAPLLNNQHRLVNAGKPADDIARIFEELVPNDSRRKLGQFRTPEYVADVMAKWSVQRGDDVVLDPGVGSGVLTSKMYSIKKETYGRESVEDMWGIDLSELAVVMTSTALKLVNGEGTPHLNRGNFMNTFAEGTQTRIDQRNPQGVPKMDAVVSNPPYSRHHELTPEEKEWINTVAESDSTLSISKRAPMYLYFYVHAAQFLEPGGRLSFVTPSEFLETNYGENLKQFLKENFHIHGFAITGSEFSIFDNARTTSCISFLERKEPGSSSSCATTFVELSEWPGTDDLLSAIHGDVEGETEYGRVSRLPQESLDPEGKWTNHFTSESAITISNLKPFREVADIKRGIATGKNEYFCLSEKEVEDWGLNERYLARLVRRADQLDQFSCTHEDWEEWRETGDTVWLLYHLPDEFKEIDDPELLAYLEHGSEIGADDSYLARNRNPWYQVDRRDSPEVFATYMSKNGFQFIHNKADVRSLNNLHNIYLSDQYTTTETKALLAYLNSQIVNRLLGQSGRTYSEGMKKIEPDELKDIPVIDPKELSSGQVADLRRFFDDLIYVSRNPDEVQEGPADVISDIDEYLESIVEFERREE